MKKHKFKLLNIIAVIFILLFVSSYALAMPRQPDNPAPAHNDDPIPPPDDGGNNDNPPGPPPTAVPTPTPCIPNWCFVKQTECCFDPICVVLGNTPAGSPNRCPVLKPEDVKYLSQSPPVSASFFQKAYIFVLDLFLPHK